MIKKLCFLFSLLPSILLAQHTIKGTFSPSEEFNFAILYKVTPTNSVYVNNTEINGDGNFTFQLDSTITKGMYRIVYALPQEEFNFDLIYNAEEDIELAFNLNDGVSYIASKENILLTSYFKNTDLISQKINQFYSQEQQDKEAFTSIFKILKDTQSEFENAAEGTIALEFIKASRSYMPNNLEDAETFSENFKASYFNHIDYGNDVLVNSNFLIESTLNYVFTFVDSTDKNTSFKSNIDTVVKEIGNHPIIKKVLLEILWNQFAEQQNETVANYISTTYLLDIAKSKNDKELIHTLTNFKTISNGEIAPDFLIKIDNEKNKNLSDLTLSENFILVFWSSSCSHCLKELPELQSHIKSINKNKIQVIAIGLENELIPWEDKIKEFTNFIHIYGEGKWDNKIGKAYDVVATPTYFVLDKDKKIISKPYDVETLKINLDQLLSKKN